jgi:hypothetical protein
MEYKTRKLIRQISIQEAPFWWNYFEMDRRRGNLCDVSVENKEYCY